VLKGKRPPRANHPARNVFAIDMAGCEKATKTILTAHIAGPRPIAGFLDELIACCFPTFPGQDPGIHTKLSDFRRIDAFEIKLPAVDFHEVPLENAGKAHQIGGASASRPKPQQQ
jgi:hypothetical protein